MCGSAVLALGLCFGGFGWFLVSGGLGLGFFMVCGFGEFPGFSGCVGVGVI